MVGVEARHKKKDDEKMKKCKQERDGNTLLGAKVLCDSTQPGGYILRPDLYQYDYVSSYNLSSKDSGTSRMPVLGL